MDIPRLASRISAVTVFASGALVARTADLSALADRPAQVRIDQLPLCLDDASLRVRIDGGAAVACDVAVALAVPPRDDRLAPPDDAELQAARLAERRLTAQVEHCEQQFGELDALAIAERPAGAEGSPPQPSPTAARLTLLSFHQQEVQRLAERRERLHEELRLATEHRGDLEAKAAAASNARQARPDELRKSAIITLLWKDGVAAASTLLVEYLVPGARWAPSYVVRFDAALAEAKVAVRAAVCQRTGEDWSGVRLALSTASALGWYELPELASRRIGRRQLRPERLGWRAPPTGAEALYADYDRDRAAQPPPSTGSAAFGAEAFVVGGVGDAPRAERRAKKREMAKDLGGAGAAMESASIAPPVGSMAAPMRPMAMPASPPAAAPMAGMAKPMAKSAAAGKARRAVAADLEERGGGGSPEVEADDDGYAEPEPAGLEPGEELLAFHALRLAGPNHAQRGKLRPAAPAELALALLVQSRITISVSVAQVLGAAVDGALQTARTGLPPGCSQPSTPQFAYLYPAELPATVPADGAWRVVTLAEQSTPVRLRHVVVPRESREVFRLAEFANPLALPLLAGPADVYLGEIFLMTSAIALTPPSAAIKLGLGVEQGITVARNTTYREDAVGMLGGSLALNHEIRISVANKLQRPAALEVRERVPVPAAGESDCKVKLGAVSPAWSPYTEEGLHDGGHRWDVQLAAGASQELAAAYTVTIPAKSEIAGGNRREI